MRLVANATAYFVLAPVSSAGVALLGDASKFVRSATRRGDRPLQRRPGSAGEVTYDGAYEIFGWEHKAPMPSREVQIRLQIVSPFRWTSRTQEGGLERRWRCGLNPPSRKSAGMPGPSPAGTRQRQASGFALPGRPPIVRARP